MAGSQWSFVTRSRIATVPNAITLARLACLPVVVAWLPDRPAAAAVLLGLLGITDWVDGWVARRFGQGSEFGAVFDPSVDRLLLFAGAAAATWNDAIPAWLGIAILAREALVAVMLAGATLAGMERFPVSIWGKRYTFGLMVSVPLLILGTSDAATAAAARIAGWVLVAPAIVTSWLTAFGYVRRVRAGLAASRARRTAGRTSSSG
ncbi:MAG: CDP-alcohol phosphatidyltransferase family protein [Acidimicrobiia bacterium]